jgi:glycosyltransferase involved in cell wall biosynthesis
VPLARAFARIAHRLPDWELCLYGSGPLQSAISHPRIKVHGFIQPEQLGSLYRQARIFALPSFSEAWGVVVHEAALSGCRAPAFRTRSVRRKISLTPGQCPAVPSRR